MSIGTAREAKLHAKMSIGTAREAKLHAKMSIGTAREAKLHAIGAMDNGYDTKSVTVLMRWNDNSVVRVASLPRKNTRPSALCRWQEEHYKDVQQNLMSTLLPA
ncbi:hypothetical protein RRG08_026412 [Elysia crispata]|uniref:Uncharacterized protein n=1 Tax=Elysia crispata TaxID=231223 RepID=A0AAE0XMT9_9GAST|nr:hypothetical protein RRG08_026412 [Elysia crispata]